MLNDLVSEKRLSEINIRAAVTIDTFHASLLILPQLAKLANSLSRWVADDLT
jgi:hypothetical protein